ncbi:MAG: hypothetical protein ACFFB0_07180 [Promethearchaeota archaeon]
MPYLKIRINQDIDEGKKAEIIGIFTYSVYHKLYMLKVLNVSYGKISILL